VIELSSAEFCRCPPLEPVPIFTGFVRTVLDGVANGRVWADAGAAHALHSYGMSLVWGAGVDRAFDGVIAHLNGGGYRTRDEWLQIDPRWAHLDWERRLNAERHTRVNFRFDRAAFEGRHTAPVLPPGWSLATLDEAAFALPDVSVTPRAFWKDYAGFLAHGGGVVVMQGGEVGAMAFASTRGDDWLEIGIETRSAYRGQGLARAAAVAMIVKVLAAGLTPIWACRESNTGSLKLAQSLGFTVAKTLPFYRLAV
jgi:hypothetical protein